MNDKNIHEAYVWGKNDAIIFSLGAPNKPVNPFAPRTYEHDAWTLGWNTQWGKIDPAKA